MRHFIIIGLILFLVSCSSQRINEDRAKELFSLNNELLIASQQLMESNTKNLSFIQKVLEENGIRKDSSNEYIKARGFTEYGKLVDNFTNKWSENMILSAGDYAEVYMLITGWNKKVTLGNTMPEAPDELLGFEKSFGNKNILIGLIEINNWRYEQLSLLRDSLLTLKNILDEKHSYLGNRMVLASSVETAIDHLTGIHLWTSEFVRRDSFLVNKEEINSTHGTLKYSRSQWESMNVKTIGIPLPDTVITFQLQPD